MPIPCPDGREERQKREGEEQKLRAEVEAQTKGWSREQLIEEIVRQRLASRTPWNLLEREGRTWP